MATTRNYVSKNWIPTILQSRIQNLQRGKRVIEGNLSVAPGHDYWWFLEYGTGQFHETPDDQFIPPDDVAGETAEGREYEIEVSPNSKATVLVYMTKGQRRRRFAVTHPGIQPIGFLRTSVFEAVIALKGQVTKAEKRKKKWQELPGREELVEIVNAVMTQLLQRLKVNTPPDSDPDPYHKDRPRPTPLAEAWRITKAK